MWNWVYNEKIFELPRDQEGMVKASDTLPEVTYTEPQDGSLYWQTHNGEVGMGQQRWDAIQFEKINGFIFQE